MQATIRLRALILSLFALPALAQEAPPTTVLVTGARFPSAPELAPIGATVITREDIRRAGVNDVDAAIRKIGGVFGRQSLDSSPDFGLDLRGFGTNSAQNMVIMVDGVRLNENELTGPALSTIAIDSVERIEIQRGGGSVLYGEGATGGVIHIVTRASAGAATTPGVHGSVFGEAGRFDERDLRAALSATSGKLSADLAAGRQSSDNYRANNDFRQTSVAAGVQLRYEGGRAGLHAERAQQDMRLPGSLTLAQFESNPRTSTTRKDFGALDTSRVNAFAEYRLGEVDLAAELSHRERSARSNYLSSDYATVIAYQGHQDQFSPRLRWLRASGAMLNELVAGVDLMRWKRKTTSDYSLADAGQKSKALYLRDELDLDQARAIRLALGVRREIFEKDVVDALAAAGSTGARETGTQAQNAWEAQASWRVLPALDVYARTGQSYRVANVDENSYRTSLRLLNAQTSHDTELGASVGDAARKLTARVFRHELRNEIFYDPTAFANTNLDPTRRSGAELDLDAALAPDWRVSGHLQHVVARFTAGPNAGREMVLVPRNVATARLGWQPAAQGSLRQSADLGVQWVDQQRYGSDFDNSCDARVPSYVTLDGRYALRTRGWELAVSGLNLADRHYFSNAFGCKTGIYPSDGRQLKLSARYEF